MIQDNDLKCPDFPMNPEDIAYSGQSTKHKFEIISPGFSMQGGDWDAVLKIDSGQSIALDESDTYFDSEGNCFLCVTSESTWVGKSTLTVTARVLDDGYPDHVRIEIFKVPFVKYIKP